MRQESAFDHGRRSPIEGLIRQPHNFAFSGPDSRFNITPEFSEQKAKPEFRDGAPIPRHYRSKNPKSTFLATLSPLKCVQITEAMARSEGPVPGCRWDNIPTPGYAATQGVRQSAEEPVK
jgi:hypothetical protein